MKYGIMQIQTFKIFCDVADTSSFSKAAAINAITQSAVSQQIRSLEERYDVLLIERGKKNFALTPEGQIFLEASRQILSTYQSLGDRIRELRNVVAGDLRIATVYSIGLHELPPFLKQFRLEYPDVNVKVEYRRSTQVYTEVQDGHVDLGLVAFPVKRKGLKVEAFWKDKLVVICPPDHAFAGRDAVTLKELSKERFISFEPDLPTRKAIDRLLKRERVEIEQVMEFDNIETVKRAVEIESGISIVPETTVLEERESGSLCVVEIQARDMWRPLGVIVKRNRGSSPAQKQFIRLLQNGLMATDQPAGVKGPLQLVSAPGDNAA